VCSSDLLLGVRKLELTERQRDERRNGEREQKPS